MEDLLFASKQSRYIYVELKGRSIGRRRHCGREGGHVRDQNGHAPDTKFTPYTFYLPLSKNLCQK
jgi:hypothetical protein